MYTIDFVNKPFLCKKCQNPLHNWSELQYPLVLHPWRTTGFLPSRRRVGGISLSFITSLRAYVLQRQFRILQQHEILYVAKTNGYSKGIRHNVRPDAKYVGCLTISVYIERAKFGCGDGHSK